MGVFYFFILASRNGEKVGDPVGVFYFFILATTNGGIVGDPVGEGKSDHCSLSVSVLPLCDQDSRHFDFDQYHDIDQHFRYSHMQQSSYDGSYPHPQTGRR